MEADAGIRAQPWVCAACLAVAALVVVVFSLTSLPDGRAGVAPDGISYLGAASNLRAGHGLTGAFTTSIDPFTPAEAAAFDGQVPFLQWPPLYSVVLALVSLGGTDGQLAAGLLNAVLFALVAATIGAVTTRMARSTVAGLCAGALFIAQPDVALLYVLVASEPLFLALVTGATWCLTRRLAGGSRQALVAAFALAGAAALTRYAGLAVVVGFAGAIALWDVGRWPSRVLRAGVAGAAAAAPAALWSLAVSAEAGVATRRFVPQVPDEAQWRFVVENVLRWLSPPGAPTPWRAAVVVLVLVGLVVAIMGLHNVLARSVQRHAPALEDESAARLSPDGVPERELLAWARVCALVVPAYVAGVVATHVLFDRGVPIGGRLMVPVLPLVLPLLVAGVVGAVRSLEPQRWRDVASVVAVVATALVVVPVGGGLGNVTGNQTVRVPAEQSATSAQLRAIDPDAVVLSNDPALVWLVSGHAAVSVPRRLDAPTGVVNDGFDAEMDEVGQLLGERGGAVVLYRAASLFGPHFARVDEFEDRGLVVVAERDDAVVLELAETG